MNEKCPTCTSCGMPLMNDSERGVAVEEGNACIYCTRPDGTLKSFQEIMEGTADHLAATQGISKKAALKLAEESLIILPYWKKRRGGIHEQS